jgi:Domain of unknown function (DUF5664)
MTQFKKFDQGKPQLSLIPRAALDEIAQVLAYGAQKYGKWNFKNGTDWSRYIDAAIRHLYAFSSNEDLDSETKLTHLAHAGCCIAFLLDMYHNNYGTDDRYPGDNEQLAFQEMTKSETKMEGTDDDGYPWQETKQERPSFRGPGFAEMASQCPATERPARCEPVCTCIDDEPCPCE